MMTPPRAKAPRSKTVKFGSMPQVIDNSPFHQQQQLPIGQQTQTQARDSGDNNQDGSYYNLCNPQLVSNDLGTNYPLAQSNETVNMGQQGYTFGMDDPFVYGIQNANTNANISMNYQIPEVSEFPYMDSAVQNLSLMQHELGMGYDGGFQALFSDQVGYDQVCSIFLHY